MMSNTKILTVSYGTFSCTLEGFEDSFDTMKAIAEYFRDLAADDRYFGAEPPQPDAEMLARIAEREIARRVEARAGEGGIHLRAGTAAALPAYQPEEPLSPQPAAEHLATASATSHVAEQSATDHVAREAAPRETAAAPAGEDTMSPIAVSDAAPVTDETAAPHSVADAISTISAPPSDQGHVSAALSPPMDANRVEPDPETRFGTSDHVQDPQEADVAEEDTIADFFARTAESEIPVAEEVHAPARRPEPNSIADKLQRIRAVVSKTRPVPQTFSEDEHAEDIVSEEAVDAATVADFFATPPDAAHEDDGSDEPASEPHAATGPAPADQVPTAAPAGDPAPADAAPEDGTGAEPDAASLFADETDADAAFDAEAAAEPQDDAATEDAADEEEDDDIAAVLARIEAGFQPEALPHAAEIDATSDTESANAAHDYDFSSLFAEDDATPPQEDEPAGAPVFRARVIKVKRSELRAAREAGMLDEDDDRTRDLATWSLDADMTDEDELDRLMSEADEKMDDEGANDRRAAFDHMRGAVAATQDDEDLETEETAEEVRYRRDFAAAVQPRRPVAGTRTDRPRDQRPAPLKLVAEQRIDVPAVKSGPVQPRRVAAAETEPTEEDSGFAEYAAARGAHDLPDLLEAAASYLSFVEGHDQFSRPQLMTKVRQLDPEGFNREDGLRHFGKLLRSGKIEKIKGGRFTVSDEIGFRPDGERAAG